MSLLRNFRGEASEAELVVPTPWDTAPAPQRPPVWRRLPVLIVAAGAAYLTVGLALTLGPELRGEVARSDAEAPAELAEVPSDPVGWSSGETAGLAELSADVGQGAGAPLDSLAEDFAAMEPAPLADAAVEPVPGLSDDLVPIAPTGEDFAAAEPAEAAPLVDPTVEPLQGGADDLVPVAPTGEDVAVAEPDEPAPVADAAVVPMEGGADGQALVTPDEEDLAAVAPAEISPLAGAAPAPMQGSAEDQPSPTATEELAAVDVPALSDLPPAPPGAAPLQSRVNDLAGASAGLDTETMAAVDPALQAEAPSGLAMPSAAAQAPAAQPLPPAPPAEPPQVVALAPAMPAPPVAATVETQLAVLSAPSRLAALPRLPEPAAPEPLALDTQPPLPRLAYALDPAAPEILARALDFPAEMPRAVEPGATLPWQALVEPEPEPVLPQEPPEVLAEAEPAAEAEVAAAPAEDSAAAVVEPTGYSIVVHAQGRLFDDAWAAQSILSQAGYDTQFAPARGVRQNSVRYFYPEDADEARAVAERLGVGLVLRMDIVTAAPPGSLEVWLSDSLGLPADETRAEGVRGGRAGRMALR